MSLHLRLIVDEEERLVLLDWAAERTAELIQVELLAERREIAPRIQFRIAEKFEQRSVILVRSGLRRHQHRGTRASSPLGGVVVLQNLEFLDRVDRRQNRDATGR